ncbi:MAG: SelB C-terminal domain-containing protein, partial [Gemmatimonadales bacterium]
ADASRGTVLVAEGASWTPTTALDVELALGAAAPRPLTQRSRVRVHLGTAEILARVRPRAPIEPGQAGVARLALEGPVVARGGDRFVVRSYSPVTTIGGGRVLDPFPPRRSTLPAEPSEGGPAACLQALLRRRPAGIPVAMLPVLLGLSPEAAGKLARLESTGRRVGDILVSAEAVAAVATRMLDRVRDFHRGHASERGMPLETLRHSVRAPDALIEATLADLAGAGRLRRVDGVVSLAGFAPRIEGGDAQVDRIVAILVEAELAPPSLSELERRTGRKDLAAILRLAAASGRVEAVERDRYYARPALDRFVEVLTEVGREAAIAPSALRDRLGISRKFLIPLLEWADSKGLTERVGDGRRLRPRKA